MAYNRPYKPRVRRKPGVKYNAKKKSVCLTMPKKTQSTAIIARRALNLAQLNNKIARGSYQTNLHKMRGTSGLQITLGTPAAFHVPTPRDNEVIWQFSQVGGGPGYAAQGADSFVKPSVAELTGGSGTSAHNLWADANDDVFNGKYMLQTMNYTFTISSLSAQTQDIRFRVDFVVPNRRRLMRATTVNTGTGLDAFNARLPDCLGAFNSLLGDSNRVNPNYFTFVRKPVYFTLKASELVAQNASSVKTIQKHIRLKINKVYNPRDIGTGSVDDASPYLSIPDAQQMWCIISNDLPVATNPTQIPGVFVTRQFSWRDRAGHAA